MVPIQQLAAVKRSARDEFLAGRYGLVCEGAHRLPGHKFHQTVAALDDLPATMVRDGPIDRLLFGVDLGAGTYGETVEASVAIGLMACRGVGNRPHAIAGLTLFQATIVHEIGHTIGFAHEHRVQKAFNRAFWPGGERDRRRGNPVTVYALMHPSEDFAEAFLHYRHAGELMRRMSAERYAWLRRHVFGGLEFRGPGRA